LLNAPRVHGHRRMLLLLSYDEVGRVMHDARTRRHRLLLLLGHRAGVACAPEVAGVGVGYLLLLLLVVQDHAASRERLVAAGGD